MIESDNLSYGEKEHLEAVNKWKERLQACEESGMTQMAWCQANHVCSSSFSKWKGRIREKSQIITGNDLVDVSFVLDNPPTPIQEAEPWEWQRSVVATIELPRVKVHVYEGASADILKSIMEAIGNA